MRIGIVGGGISGLAVHHFLRRAGVESVVYEAADEPGGVIESARVDGRLLEFGPQRTRLVEPVRRLIEDVGLGDEVVEAEDRPLYVYYEGRLRRVPLSPGAALTTDLLSWRGKLRALLEPLTGPPREGETVREYLVRAFGREVADRMLGPLYGGIYASHPGEMPARHSLARVIEERGVAGSLLVTAAKATLRGADRPPMATFAEGLQALPRALSERHAGTVTLNAPVEAVRDAGDRFELVTRSGTDVVDEAVLATPAGETADLLESVTPGAATALGRLTYNPLAVVHLYSDGDLDAAGYQVQIEADLRTLGVTCNASLFDRDGVYTCFLGGWKTPEALEWSDARLGETAAREFEAVTGCAARPLHVRRLPRAMPAYDTSWTALDGLTLPTGIHLCANYRARPGIPGRIAEARRLASALAR